MLTIAPPPRSRITAAAACVHRNIDSRLSRNIARHSSSEISASGWSGKFCPALLTRMSTGPSRSSASAKKRVDARPPCPARRRSPRPCRRPARSPRPRASRPGDPAGSGRRPVPRPSRTAWRCRPRSPATHPVTIATRPVRSSRSCGCGTAAGMGCQYHPHAPRGIPPQARLREDAGAGAGPHARRPPARSGPAASSSSATARRGSTTTSGSRSMASSSRGRSPRA